MLPFQFLTAIFRSNATFAMLSFRLGMANSPTSKPSANNFEAYIHILSIDQNKELLRPWLKRLIMPSILFARNEYIYQV